AGYPLEEVYRSCVERNQSAQCSFIISELNYLYRGGRCGKLALLGANLLKLRPVIVTGKDGKFATGKKFRGPIRKCILSYVDDLLHSYSNFDYSCAYINYSWLEDPSVIQDVIAKAKEAGFKEVIETQASPTNGYHAGPNVLGFQFLYDGEHIVKPYSE
ncbi:MAG: DegV family protein, partial [Bacilli bacterium]|nr:DegV family protein [Bacilli bacterium]